MQNAIVPPRSDFESIVRLCPLYFKKIFLWFIWFISFWNLGLFLHKQEIFVKKLALNAFLKDSRM